MNDPSPVGAAMQPPPEAQMMQLASGCLVAPTIYIVAKLGIADLLKDGPKTAAQLAEETASDADSLYRVLRAAASIGVLYEDAGHVFSNTTISETLRVDWPKSTRAMTLWMLEP